MYERFCLYLIETLCTYDSRSKKEIQAFIVPTRGHTVISERKNTETQSEKQIFKLVIHKPCTMYHILYNGSQSMQNKVPPW